MGVYDFDSLRKHVGHEIVCVGYGLKDLETGAQPYGLNNVAVECETCNEVLLDFDNERAEVEA